MRLSVEFYGIARLRASIGLVQVELPDGPARLADVFEALAERLPAFGEHCLAGGGLEPSLTCNIDGQRFTSDPRTPVSDGQTVLILSADAGG